MTHRRMDGIVKAVSDKFIGRPLNDKVVAEIYTTMSQVILGLHKREHFLNALVDFDNSLLMVKDEETIEYLGFLPYLDHKLLEEDMFLVYFQRSDGLVENRGACRFYDFYKKDHYHIGIGVDCFASYPLGIYYPQEDRFIPFKDDLT